MPPAVGCRRNGVDDDMSGHSTLTVPDSRGVRTSGPRTAIVCFLVLLSTAAPLFAPPPTLPIGFPSAVRSLRRPVPPPSGPSAVRSLRRPVPPRISPGSRRRSSPPRWFWCTISVECCRGVPRCFTAMSRAPGPRVDRKGHGFRYAEAMTLCTVRSRAAGLPSSGEPECPVVSARLAPDRGSFSPGSVRGRLVRVPGAWVGFVTLRIFRTFRLVGSRPVHGPSAEPHGRTGRRFVVPAWFL
ncbi:hypothetical protein CEDDRAFT_01653 [Frankia sp. CeD]|nr:hypothetical protein CEDDRAFT_01653 [Frankia sp. CeD]